MSVYNNQIKTEIKLTFSINKLKKNVKTIRDLNLESCLSQADKAKEEVEKVSLTTIVMRRVKTPELQQEFLQTREAMMQLSELDCVAATTIEQESRLGEQVATLLGGGLDNRPPQQRQQDSTQDEEQSWSGLCWKAFSALLP